MDLNKSIWYDIVKNVKIIQPNNKGSVGNAISKSKKVNPKSDSEIDNGVKATMIQNKYLSPKVEITTMDKTSGIAKMKYFSSDKK